MKFDGTGARSLDGWVLCVVVIDVEATDWYDGDGDGHAERTSAKPESIVSDVGPKNCDSADTTVGCVSADNEGTSVSSW